MGSLTPKSVELLNSNNLYQRLDVMIVERKIDRIVEASPNYSPERKRPKDKTEARILKGFQYK